MRSLGLGIYTSSFLELVSSQGVYYATTTTTTTTGPVHPTSIHQIRSDLFITGCSINHIWMRSEILMNNIVRKHLANQSTAAVKRSKPCLHLTTTRCNAEAPKRSRLNAHSDEEEQGQVQKNRLPLSASIAKGARLGAYFKLD